MERQAGNSAAPRRTRADGKNTASELAAVLERVPPEKRARLLASAQALRFAAEVAGAEKPDE
jgi:hypothetical protein